jgi:SAM-dependent methyltransferase
LPAYLHSVRCRHSASNEVAIAQHCSLQKRQSSRQTPGACSASSLGLDLGRQVRVLDLGAGKGAAARHLAKTFGCHVTCFNLGRNQNAHNAMEAAAGGVGGLIDCVLGNFNDGLPAEWTASFDVVWSQEALCHACSQRDVLGEICRVLKPGGAVVFTDIMRTVRRPALVLLCVTSATPIAQCTWRTRQSVAAAEPLLCEICLHPPFCV